MLIIYGCFGFFEGNIIEKIMCVHACLCGGKGGDPNLDMPGSVTNVI